MSEEEVMKKRLTMEGDGGSDDRRIMSLLKTFVKWCNSNELSDEEREATYEKMLFTLGQCEFSFLKTEVVMEMNRREMERYEEVYHEIESNIEVAKQQITSYKDELQQAREIRRHRQEYDALAKVIQQHPPRQQSQEKIKKLELQLSNLIGQQTALDKKLELRRKQFQLLVTCVHQLQDDLQVNSGLEGQDEVQDTLAEQMDTS